MIDLHAHVLPGIDDGPADVEAAQALLAAMAGAGVGCVVATPHVSDEYPNTAATIAAAREALGDPPPGIVVSTGAEVTIERALAAGDEALEPLRLGGGPWLLVECPLSPWIGEILGPLERLRARGLRLVLAHPERSPVFQRDPTRALACVAAGDLCAITAGAMAGSFGRTAREMCVHLLRQGLAQVVTSDAHDLAGRPPGLLDGFAAIEDELPGIAAHACWYTEGVPAAILAGTQLPPPPPPFGPPPGAKPPRQRWLRRR